MVATYEQSGLTYEDTSVVYDGMAETRVISVLLGSLDAAEDITEDVNASSLVIEDNGTAARGVLSCRVERTPIQLTTLGPQALLRIIDHTTQSDMARGVIRSYRPSSVPTYTAVDIDAEDVGGVIDDTFIAIESRASETMQVRVSALWSTYAQSPPLDTDDLSYIASIGSALAAQDFVGVTLRQAIEATISQASASADYYIDPVGRLHVFTSESNPAPKDIDADAPGAGEIAPMDLSIDYDSGSYANRVYIAGGTPDGSGYFSDTAAIAAAGGIVRTAVVEAPDCTTSAMATALSNMYLGRVSSSKPRGQFSTTTTDGWRAGQNVLVTSAAFGLSAQSFRIARVETRVLVGGSGMRRLYRVEFGGARAGGGGVTPTGLGVGQLVSGQLGGASNTYVTSDGVRVTDGTNTRAELGKLSATDYGLRVTSSDGSTVIIDGTSNMFKIQATGTQTLAFPAAGNGSGQEVTLTGLGAAYTTPPQCLYTTADDTSATLKRSIDADMSVDLTAGHMNWRASSYVKLNASPGQVVIALDVASMLSTPGGSASQRYYVLAETAI